jgi:hypothetical protein
MGIYEGRDENGKGFKEMFEGEEGFEWLRKGMGYREEDAYKGGMRRYGASKMVGVMFMYVHLHLLSLELSNK